MSFRLTDKRNKKQQNMKRILVTMMAGLVLAASVPVVAQKHRHTPVATVKVNSQTDDNGEIITSCDKYSYQK